MSLTERSWQLVASLSQVVLCARGISGLDVRVSRRMSLPGASKITQLLNGVDHKDGVGLVAVVDQALAELESQGMVWTAGSSPASRSASLQPRWLGSERRRRSQPRRRHSVLGFLLAANGWRRLH